MKFRNVLSFSLLCAAFTAAGPGLVSWSKNGTTPPPSPPVNTESPLGQFDGFDCNYIYGWTFDPDVPAESAKIHIYVDEPPTPPAYAGFLMEATANTSRPDVNAHFGISGSHGFMIPTPQSLKDGQPHTLYIFGIDNIQPGYNPQLGASPKTATCATTSAVTYYVSSGGSDSNDGTAVTRAFRTIEKVNGLNLAPGDIVAFEGGATFDGNLMISKSGTAVQPIQVTSYATSAGDRAHIRAGDGEGIVLEDNAYVVVSKLKISGAGTSTNRGHGIKLVRTLAGAERLKSIAIDAVEVHGFYWAGIAFYADGNVPIGYNGIRVTNADVHDNGYAGIWMGGCAWDPAGMENGTYCFENVYVGYSRIHDNPGIDVPEQTGNGLILKQVKGGMIEHSLAYNNGSLNRNTGGGPVGLWAVYSSNVTIQFNESYNNHSRSLDGGGFDLDGGTKNSVMQYNYSHDNDGAGFLVWVFDENHTTNNVIRYNVSQNDGASRTYYGGILVGSSYPGWVVGLQIYGNTIYTAHGDGAAAIGFMGSVTGVGVRNNIFLTNNNTPLVHDRFPAGGVTMQGNVYWAFDGAPQYIWSNGSYPSLAAWRGGTGQEMLGSEATGFQIDPRLVAAGAGGTLADTSMLPLLTAYQLTGTSPIRDLGLLLPAFGIGPGSRDFYGNAIPQGSGFEIGAHELPPATVPPQTPKLLTNGGFESGDSPWRQWWWTAVSPQSHYIRDSNGPRTGSWKADHWDPGGGNLGQYTYQVVTGLQNGNYTLRGWVRTSGGLDTVELGAKNFGAAQQMRVNIPVTNPITSYTLYELSNIPVTNGQVEVFFWTYALSPYKWTTWDDFELVKQ